MVDTTNPQTPPNPQQASSGDRLAAAASRMRNATQRLNRRRVGYSWDDYFKRGSDQVWVQNRTDMQASFEIDDSHGNNTPVLIPPVPDPYCLTDEIPFEVLAKSTKFRTTMNKRDSRAQSRGQQILVFLDEEQVADYYAAKAIGMNAYLPNNEPDIEAAIIDAQRTFKELTSKQAVDVVDDNYEQNGFAPPRSAQELVSMDLAGRGLAQGTHTFGKFGANADAYQQNQMAKQARFGEGVGVYGLTEHDVINPKVITLCHQVNPQIPPQERTPEHILLQAFRTMANALTLDDLGYIESHGGYKSVRDWARDQARLKADAIYGAADAKEQQPQQPQQVIMPPAPAQHPGNVRPLPRVEGYEGPRGFANAPFQEAASGYEPASIIGPNGLPLPTSET